ncbi:sarcosine oxidase subunit delta [Parasphingopyxis sp.]|uniref:sarcosine oxidase subunit delta n=1 Tax=Parasphingopyxis sp. TaxID=1920299 RepID=UPI002609D615|nr:sarcosine oxidase subunit delta [Parasphingopyxis sp.]
MLIIPCPWCGARDESEFAYGGEADIVRPPAEVSDAAWAEYLYVRDNPRGKNRELWFHRDGCFQWFVLERDTATNECLSAHRIDPPGEEG